MHHILSCFCTFLNRSSGLGWVDRKSGTGSKAYLEIDSRMGSSNQTPNRNEGKEYTIEPVIPKPISKV